MSLLRRIWDRIGGIVKLLLFLVAATTLFVIVTTPRELVCRWEQDGALHCKYERVHR